MYRATPATPATPATQGITPDTPPNATDTHQRPVDNSASNTNHVAANLARQLNISTVVPHAPKLVAGATPRETVAKIAARFQLLRTGSMQLSDQLNQSANNHHLLPVIDMQRQGYEDLLKNLRELPVNLRDTSFTPGCIRSVIYQIEKLLSIEVPLRRILWEEGTTQSHIEDVGYLQLIENLKPFIAATHKRIDNLIDLYNNSKKSETQFLFTAANDTFATLHQTCSRIMMYLDIDAAEINANQAIPPNKSLDDVRHYLKYFAVLVLENSPLVNQTPTENGVYCRIEKSSFELYANTLPQVAQLKEVSLAGLLCVIELNPEDHDGNPSLARQDAQRKAISHFELLLDLCEKCEQIVRKVCLAENWPDLLERSPRNANVLQRKLEQQFSKAIQSDASAFGTDDEHMDPDTADEVNHPTIEISKRITGLLKKAEGLLNSNPRALLAATNESPGIYSPEFVQNIRQTFCKSAEVNQTKISQLVEKIQVELNRDTCNAFIKSQLDNTCISLRSNAACLQEEIEYSQSERFVFHTLKSYSIPKEQHWKRLLDSGQIDSVELTRNPATDAPNDNLYQFRLSPVSNNGTDYEPAWLHVHLKKEVHVPRQWQALQQSDVSAAHLKSNLNHHRGANWQEDQRRKGNYEAVVRRSPVSLEFVKEIAARLEPKKLKMR